MRVSAALAIGISPSDSSETTDADFDELFGRLGINPEELTPEVNG